MYVTSWMHALPVDQHYKAADSEGWALLCFSTWERVNVQRCPLNPHSHAEVFGSQMFHANVHFYRTRSHARVFCSLFHIARSGDCPLWHLYFSFCSIFFLLMALRNAQISAADLSFFVADFAAYLDANYSHSIGLNCVLFTMWWRHFFSHGITDCKIFYGKISAVRSGADSH